MPCKFQNLYLGVRGWWWRSGAVVVDEVRIVRCMKKNDRRCVRRSTTRSREPFVLREVPTNLQTLSGLLDVEVRIWDSRWSRSRDAKKFPAVENKLSCCLVWSCKEKEKAKGDKKRAWPGQWHGGVAKQRVVYSNLEVGCPCGFYFAKQDSSFKESRTLGSVHKSISKKDVNPKISSPML